MATSRSDGRAGSGRGERGAQDGSGRRLLIANRGEIALRILRGARDEGWTAIAVYSEADRRSLHASLADEAYLLGPAAAAESYLNIPRLLEVARRSRATHVHPGYGFLAENADFAQACADAGLVFVGPSAAAIRAMGDKVAARQSAERAGVPIIPGTSGLTLTPKETVAVAEEIGYPVLIKAAFGGGGKGMRLCRNDKELIASLELARGEAARAFGNDTIYIERAIERPRHIEIQILCDHHGHGIYLGERECSIQRRHQKLIEECPSTAVDAGLRRRMGEAAVRLALGIGYRNAGTVEFLLAPWGQFYFLEMNTRLQVEHPVTEAVTGIDLVRAQLRIALDEPLPWKQEDIRPQGWAIECRICAEDPARNFLPTSGKIIWARPPQGPGVRNDWGIETGSDVPVLYDPLVGKLITWGGDREQARERMLRALEETRIEGIPTNLAFHRWALSRPEFIAGKLHTGFIEDLFRPEELLGPREEELLARIAAVAAYRERETPAAGGPAAGSASGLAGGRSGFASDPLAPVRSPWKRAGRR